MHPTILIGLDGATFHILESFIKEGHLPFLKSFIEEGVSAGLLSTPQPLTPPAWTTVMTGKTPGNHGIFDFIWAEEREGAFYFTLNNFRDVQAETIWSIVSRSGGSVTSLNYSPMAPPPAVDGFIVPGLVSWKHLRLNVYPKDLYDEFKQLPGFDAKNVAWDFEREKQATKAVPEQEREDWIRFHVQREDSWYQIYRYLRSKRKTDLTAILIDGTDKLQHVVWNVLDPDYFPANPTESEKTQRELALGYYKRLDDFLREVADEAGPEARIVMVSDHGFGPTEKVFRVNRWLSANGYLHWGGTDHLDASEKDKIDKMVQGHFVHLDWAKTTAYCQSSATNGVHIRVAREPGQTGIRPEDYDSFRDKLADELLAIRDPDTGTPIVQKVLKRDEAFAGPNNQRAPDLTLILFDHGFVSTLNKDPIIWNRPEVSGTHHPEGVFLARGPGIKQGVRLGLQEIVDVAPTVLHSLGLPIPSDFDGGVIEEAFDAKFLADQPVRTGEPTEFANANADEAEGPDADEERLIYERLRALGYVE